MSRQTLLSLHAIGDRMLEALERDDYDAFCDLIQERDSLVRVTRGTPLEDDLRDLVQALGEQNARLERSMKESEQRLSRDLSAFARYRSAATAYRGAPRAGRLNKSLAG